MPVFPFAIGAGSNLLVRDGGMAGVVVSTKSIRHEHIQDKTLTVEAAFMMRSRRMAARHGIAGLEFLVGAFRHYWWQLTDNAGAGKEFRDVVKTATAIDRKKISIR